MNKITGLLIISFCFKLSVQEINAQEKGLVNTSESPYALLSSVDMDAVKWTDGFWAEHFEICKDSMVPGMWEKLSNVYAVTKDRELDRLMDDIIKVIAGSQREDGYLHTPVIIQQLNNSPDKKEFLDRLDFETYNIGYLMTATCIHCRATGKTSLLDVAEKATDFLYDFYKRSSPELARSAIYPSHYMGVVEMYLTTGKTKYLELAENLTNIRGLVKNGTDQNQDRIPFR
jgi:DUF1680 family protein